MEKLLKKFASDDAGNSTVDWIVLSSGLVFLGAALAISIGSSTGDLTEKTRAEIEKIEPNQVVEAL